MKAVVWTDALQMTVVIVGLVTLLFRGILAVGGLGQALDTFRAGSRLDAIRCRLLPTYNCINYKSINLGTFRSVISIFIYL
jgi:Na+/pantothenate symporter